MAKHVTGHEMFVGELYDGENQPKTIRIEKGKQIKKYSKGLCILNDVKRAINCTGRRQVMEDYDMPSCS